MPLSSQWQTFQLDKFTGENRIPSLEMIQPDQFYIAYNSVATPDYKLESRKGKTVLNTTLGAGPIRGLWRFVKSNGNAYLVALHGTTLYSGTWAGGTATWTPASIKTGLDATATLRGVVWKDNLILTNGVQAMFRFDGSTCTDLAGTSIKSQFITFYANRLFIVDVANPNNLIWSDLETYDTWNGLNIINIRTNDGDAITGMAPMTGGMVIFKRNSAWTLYGTNKDDMQLVQLSDKVGCIAPDSIINDGVMVSYDNLWTFNLSSMQEFARTHKNMFTTLTLAQKKAIKAQIVPFDKRMVWMLPHLCLNYEGTTGGMTTWTGINAASFGVANGANDDGSLLIGDNDNGIVYALNNDANDNGTPFVTEFWMPFSDYSSTREKIWRIFQPDISILRGNNADNTATITFKYDIDHGLKRGYLQDIGTMGSTLILDNGDDWNEKQWGPNSTLQRFMINNARGRTISFRMASVSRFRFEGFSAQYREAGKLL